MITNLKKVTVKFTLTINCRHLLISVWHHFRIFWYSPVGKFSIIWKTVRSSQLHCKQTRRLATAIARQQSCNKMLYRSARPFKNFPLIWFDHNAHFRYLSCRVRAHSRSKTFLGRWSTATLGLGRIWLRRKTPDPLPHVLPSQVLSFWVKWYERNYGGPSGKFNLSHPLFQGHSWSSEPTRIDRLPMTSYLWVHLVPFPRQTQIFPTPCI